MVCCNTTSRLHWLNLLKNKKGKSLSTAGRDHIHHKLMKKFSSKGTLLVLLVTFLTGIFGILFEIYFKIHIINILFLIYAFIYYLYTGFLEKVFIDNN